MREDLRNLYSTYFSREGTYVDRETKRLNHLRSGLEERSLSLDERIAKIQQEKSENYIENPFAKEIKEKEIELVSFRSGKDDAVRKLGRIEGILEGIDRQINATLSVKERVIPLAEWKSIVLDLEERIDQALSLNDVPSIIETLHSMKNRLSEFHNQKEDGVREVDGKFMIDIEAE